jgi:hypothetical protein
MLETNKIKFYIKFDSPFFARIFKKGKNAGIIMRFCIQMKKADWKNICETMM